MFGPSGIVVVASEAKRMFINWKKYYFKVSEMKNASKIFKLNPIYIQHVAHQMLINLDILIYIYFGLVGSFPIVVYGSRRVSLKLKFIKN